MAVARGGCWLDPFLASNSPVGSKGRSSQALCGAVEKFGPQQFRGLNFLKPQVRADSRGRPFLLSRTRDPFKTLLWA